MILPAALAFASCRIERPSSPVLRSEPALTRPATTVQTPSIDFPKPASEQPTADYLSWTGLGFLPAGTREVPNSFTSPGDWSAVEAAATQPDDPQAVQWHLKLFVLKRIDEVEKLPDGTLYEEKCSLETPEIQQIQRAAKLLATIVKAETGGKLKLVTDLQVNEESMVRGDRTIAQVVSDYVYPRFNGGAYQAEDHVYRGPYESVICLHGVPTVDEGSLEINETPVAYLSDYRPGLETDGALALTLARIWVTQVAWHARQSGVLGRLGGVPDTNPGTGLENPELYVPGQDWSAVIAGADLAAGQIAARLKLPVPNGSENKSTQTKLLISSYKGVASQVAISSDPEHGSVLTYSEKGENRTGGVDLPNIQGSPIVDVAKTPTLEFWARSASRDPLALRLQAPNGQTAYLCLGSDLPGPTDVPKATFARDGQWHHVKADLKPTGLSSIARWALVPSPNALEHAKITFGPVEYSFAEFQTTNNSPDAPPDPVAPDPESADPWVRARWANSANPSPQLLNLLKDSEAFVRLNALQKYIAHPDPSAEAAITDDAMHSIDGPVGAAAVDALWKLGTDTAKATIHQIILTGVTEQGKAEAASVLTEGKDAAEAVNLIVLQDTRALATQIATVYALSRLPGANASLIRWTFVMKVDPELRLAVTRTSDPNDPYQWKKLLWSSVNEESDAVRLESDQLLISSKDPTAHAGGEVAVKDDSLGVRIQFLRYLAAHPDEANRNAVRQAVTDRSARVKAAAILAFAALPKGAQADELGAALTDTHPVVQLALIELAKKRNFRLPDEVVASIRQSGDPQVRAAAQTLTQ
ncbi:MAG TPA: hypothetical protein VG944_03810 [Fimbriimonas sp.]|nr:hypothetical protein [Fimbriimonas sp.]